MTYSHTQKGFSLLELITVIAIIGLIANVVFASLGNAKSKASDNQRAQFARQVLNAIEINKTTNGTYPTNNYAGSSFNNLRTEIGDFIPNFNADPTGLNRYYYGTPTGLGCGSPAGLGSYNYIIGFQHENTLGDSFENLFVGVSEQESIKCISG